MIILDPGFICVAVLWFDTTLADLSYCIDGFT